MKKLLACTLIGALAFILGACGSSTEKEEAEQESAALAVEGELAAEEELAFAEADAETAAAVDTASDPARQGTGEVSTDKIAFEIEEEEELDLSNATIIAEAADVPDVSSAVEGSATSEENPAPVGAWVKTALYATQDSAYHTVYVRVAKVTTESEDPDYVYATIEASNTYGEDSDQIEREALGVPDDGELVVLDYEVYVPVDFPSPSYGMPEPKMYFSVRNIGGGGFPTLDGEDVYLGLGSTTDLIVRGSGEVYLPGDTYGERCIYPMVRGYTGYVATYSSYPEGTASDATSEDNMYTVYHSVN